MVLPLIGIATLLRCTAKKRLLLLFLESLVGLAARDLRPLMRCGIGNIGPGGRSIPLLLSFRRQRKFGLSRPLRVRCRPFLLRIRIATLPCLARSSQIALVAATGPAQFLFVFLVGFLFSGVGAIVRDPQPSRITIIVARFRCCSGTATCSFFVITVAGLW